MAARNETPPAAIPASATVVVVPEPAPAPAPEDNDALDALGERIEALETRITEAVEGERTWTTQTITSLRQELADLKVNLTQMAEGIPGQLTELKAELARLSRSLQQAPDPVAEPVTAAEIPPAVPPTLPDAAADTPPPVSAPVAEPSGTGSQRPKRRVV